MPRTSEMGHNYPVKRMSGVHKRLHVHIAETVLGHPLPHGAVVHHVNENRRDNRNENLVICPNRTYHNLLHARMKAQQASGDPDKRPCRWCHQYDDLQNLHVAAVLNSFAYWHPECGKLKQRYYRSAKRAQNF